MNCPICGRSALALHTVDFNKSCEETRGRHLPCADIPVRYLQCLHCGFCFAPDLCAWPPEEFERRIYNEAYPMVDPDYADARPRANAAALRRIFAAPTPGMRHLDYGGGNGLLSRLLRENGWNSASYDPLSERGTDPARLGQFQLITAFEVFEHVPDVRTLLRSLRTLLAPEGLVMFSTLTSDGEIHAQHPLTWWYAAPRNGHISLFSRASLGLLAAQGGFNFHSLNAGMHLFFTTIPPWAMQLWEPA